ncbi:class I SAM-dependent methyltransferase [Streptomyces sp. NPDC006285]|uniref:class I SAM-dependent methyltransferase n=1 Tax=Streptomyces sp. NPDC006285 TaxID=3364742 RepID=UPI00369141F7
MSDARREAAGRETMGREGLGREGLGREAPAREAAARPTVARQTTRQEANGRSWTADPYADALRTGRGPLFLRRHDGWLLPLEVERWCARADAVDLQVLGRCEGAVLDVGCGPGRLVAELAARGRPVLGIDVSRAAVAHTLRLGGQALTRSVFDPLPGEGRWDTALLLDGNLGIGGTPSALLGRLAELLRPGGLLIAETVPVDVDERAEVRLVSGAEAGRGTGAAFRWARLGTPALLRHARPLGWHAAERWTADGRSFVALRSRTADGSTGGSAEPTDSRAVISRRRPGKPRADSVGADR